MKTVILGAGLVIAASATAGADIIDGLQTAYRGSGAGAFSAEGGRALWQRVGTGERSCATCHGHDLRRPGKHATTQKLIEPMAPSANAARFTYTAKVEKWFLRNCKWTWGRECSAQEKGDLLQYLRGL